MRTFVVIEVPGSITSVPSLSGQTTREICRAETMADLANVIEEIGAAAATSGRVDPGRPATAEPHMVRFRKALRDEGRAAGLEFDDDDEDDTPLAPSDPNT